MANIPTAERQQIIIHLGACSAALDESTFDFPLDRPFFVGLIAESPIDAYDVSEDRFAELRDELFEVFGRNGVTVFRDFGPYRGSLEQYLFCSFNRRLVGEDFKKAIEKLRADLAVAVAKGKRGMVITMIVANGLFQSVESKDVSEWTHLPPKVVEVLFHASNLTVTLTAVREQQEKHRQANQQKMQQHAEEENAEAATAEEQQSSPKEPRRRVRLGDQPIDLDE
jgi:hypothetical protein